MILHEAPWFSVEMEIPTTTGGRARVERLDPRLEDLKKYGGFPIKDIFNWLAPVPWLGDGLYLTHDHGIITREHPAVGMGWAVLPDDWWEYAKGTIGLNTWTKAPKYNRPGEPTQEEIDVAGGELVMESASLGGIKAPRKRRDNAAMAPLPEGTPHAAPDQPRPSRVSVPCEGYQARLRQALCRPF